MGGWINQQIKGSYTKIPERDIETIKNLQLTLSSNEFVIKVFDKDEPNNLKVIIKI